jgi:hypothetical protein
MSGKKQTAVEWLEEQRKWSVITNEHIEQAKALEKEQMDKVSEDWFVEGCSHMKENKRIYQSFEQYYTSTYGK